MQSKAAYHELAQLDREARDIELYLKCWPDDQQAKARLAMINWAFTPGEAQEFDRNEFRNKKILERGAAMESHLAVVRQCQVFREEMEARMGIAFPGSGKSVE
jgi:hypothetical protein